MARITARQTLINEGVNIPDGVKIRDCDKAMAAVGAMVIDSIAPACCDEGCVVEPDGECEHGCPSILLALGIC
jgi:hypothetical protein